MRDRASIIERIRKLLDRDTARGATEAEAATALSLARKLMDEHDLDVETVRSSEAIGDEWVTESAWEGPGLRVPPEGDMIGTLLTRYFNVVTFSEWCQPPGFGCAVRIFGDRPNVEVARWVYCYLSGVFAGLWIAYRVETRCRKDRQRAYYLGLARGLARRLESEGRAPAADEPGVGRALALRSSRLEAAFDAAFPNTSRRRGGAFRDRSTILAGQAAGAQINIARPMSASAHKGLPAPAE